MAPATATPVRIRPTLVIVPAMPADDDLVLVALGWFGTVCELDELDDDQSGDDESESPTPPLYVALYE